jgi:hypothetical protein
MAQADSVPTAIQAPVTGAISNQFATRIPSIGQCIVDRASMGPIPACALGYATAVLLLGWWPWNVLLILLLFRCRSDRGGAL